MARSRSTEWVVPRDYGEETFTAGGVTVDIPLLDITSTFNAYGTDEVTLLALKGHIVVVGATSALPEPAGWRIRKGLQNLTSLAIVTSGGIDDTTTAEEHFLDERWFLTDPADLIAIDPYYLKVDVSNKRVIRRGEALTFALHYQAPGGQLTIRTYIRALVLL